MSAHEISQDGSRHDRLLSKSLILRLRSHWLSAGMQTVLDVTILSAAIVVAYLLRFEFVLPSTEVHPLLIQIPFVVLLQYVALSLTGARSAIWRYTGMAHIRPFFLAALASVFVITVMRFELPETYHSWRIPLSVNLIDCMLAFGGTFGLRVLRRGVFEQSKRRSQVRANGNGHGSAGGSKTKSVLLIGAGQAGVNTAKEIEGRGDLGLDIKGFIDDDRMKLGRTVIQGHRVLGSTRDLPNLVRSLGIDRVVITIAQASRQDIHRIVKVCEQIPVKVKIIPGLYEILDGSVGISSIRDVRIEDLLGRETVQLDIESISRALAGKTVMITGAGGSIGSELARQVQRFAPQNLLLVDRAEFALFDIDLELKHSGVGVPVVPLVGDVGDESRMRGIFEAYQPQVIIHAAAHKHVPMMELNPIEAVKNNVMNSRLLAELAGEYSSEVFVLVSTDKAVRPESIMGASKRAAELVIQDLTNCYSTRYVAVRFGNVIGSAGSVIPIFRKQIRNGGPVTITDRRMKRYFMTIPEAAQLVLQTSTLAKGGEVFILHMGEPVRIMALAESLITLSGLKPHEDIKIVETGIRPGEKLYEELSFESEETVATSHPKIFINKLATLETETVRLALLRFAELIRYGDAPQLRSFLNDLIPEAHLNGKALEIVTRAFEATAVGR